VIKVVEVERKDGKVLKVTILINDYIESTWISSNDKVFEVSRANYNSRFFDRDILYIEKEEYQKLMRIIYAIFNSNKTGRK